MTSTEDRPAHNRTEASVAPDAERYALTLFVSGASDSSAQAIANVRKMCDAYLPGRHRLNIVDLHQDPALAAEHRVLATPTLVKDHPLPSRMLVGDMSNHRRILAGLDVDLTGLVPGAGALDARVPSARQ